MLSRVAENLYWLGRNLERVENIARMAEVSYYASVEAGGLHTDPQVWDAVITATGGHARFDEAREADPSVSPGEFLLLSTVNPDSLRSTLNHARRLARELREQLSRDVWEEINQLYLEVRRVGPVSGSGMADFYDSVRRGIAAVFGLFDNTVQLDDGRDWFRCGIFIERADMTSRILDAKSYVVLPAGQDVGGSVDRVQWTSVLRSAGARQAFRMTHRAPPSGPAVATMLVQSERFPRSLRFCIRAFRRHYEGATALTPPSVSVHASRELALLDLDLSSLDEPRLSGEHLHEFLYSFQARLSEIDVHLHKQIFRLTPSAIG